MIYNEVLEIKYTNPNRRDETLSFGEDRVFMGYSVSSYGLLLRGTYQAIVTPWHEIRELRITKVNNHGNVVR